MPKEILTVAGETSGDILGAAILKEVLDASYAPYAPHAYELTGIGGAHLKAIGQQQFYDCHALAVRGYLEALPALYGILKIRAFLLNTLKKKPPALYIGIDAADFNLHIEAYAKTHTKVIHIISPSVWAWRAKRIQKIKQAVDHLLCIFPFEVDLYQQHGVNASFIGHPLAQSVNLVRSQHLKTTMPQMRISKIAILPGSRVSEIHTLLPIFLQVAQQLERQGVQSIYLPIANAHLAPIILNYVKQYPLKNLVCVYSMAQALIDTDAALVASGTATLEVALYGVPMVIAYVVPKITAYLMQKQALINCVGLPNIIHQKMHAGASTSDASINMNTHLVPEFLQADANVAQLYRAMSELLADTQGCASSQKKAFLAMHAYLFLDNGIALAKDVIRSYL